MKKSRTSNNNGTSPRTKGGSSRARGATHSTQQEEAAHALLTNLTQAASAQRKAALSSSASSLSASAQQNPSSPPETPQKKNRSRSPYKCHKCGKPKKGHICTILPSEALIKGREAKLPVLTTPLSPPSSQHQPIQMDHFYDPTPSSPPLSQGRGLSDSLNDSDYPDNYFSTSSLDLAAMFPVPSITSPPTNNSTTATTTTTTTTTATPTTAPSSSTNATTPSPFNTSFTNLGELTSAIMWNTDSLFADSADEDWAALGYIDERFPIGGVGVKLNSKKKAPFFVSWFEMAYGGLDMLATFLKTQRPHWPPLQDVLANLEAEKEKINIWKEDFDRNVIKRALADHESSSAVPTSDILGHTSRAPRREVIEVEDSQNSSQDSQENYGSPAKRRKIDHDDFAQHSEDRSDSQEN